MFFFDILRTQNPENRRGASQKIDILGRNTFGPFGLPYCIALGPFAFASKRALRCSRLNKSLAIFANHFSSVAHNEMLPCLFLDEDQDYYLHDDDFDRLSPLTNMTVAELLAFDVAPGDASLHIELSKDEPTQYSNSPYPTLQTRDAFLATDALINARKKGYRSLAVGSTCLPLGADRLWSEYDRAKDVQSWALQAQRWMDKIIVINEICHRYEPNRPTSSEHASFDELPPPSTASVHPPGQPPLARAVMSSSSAAPTAEEIRALIQQALDVHNRDNRSSSSSPPDTTTETASVPRVPAATSITFEAVNRLKDEATYPRWHRALKALVPTPIFSYLQTGTFPAEWSIATQDQWKDYVQSERYSPRDAQAYAKLIQRFWSMPRIPLSSKDDFDKHLNHDLDLARDSTNFNDGLDPWRETFLQLHQGKDRLPSLEETMKSMRVAAHNIIDKHPSAYVSNSDKSGTPPGPCPACKTGPLHWLRECTNEDVKC
ncbi:BQ5605_C019g08833 [Microbotryum silenes-dioicae]|uniref:BQ5605_C019g08833 protein n=1 Tax=Microbotryum silenes-dioicae TaxID=796604 RepID=A0A2X0NZU5_9BASI|nr:BQ5605_C019g08833 [Microbotryum silenes-dioicae]